MILKWGKNNFASFINKLSETPEIVKNTKKKIIEPQLFEGTVVECPIDDLQLGYYMSHPAVIETSKQQVLK